MNNKNNKQERLSEQLSSFLAFIRHSETDYNHHKRNQKLAEDATQDLLHQIEFGAYSDRRRTSTILAKCRRDRRVHKNQVEILEGLVEYFQTPEHIRFLRDLEQILGNMRKIENEIYSRDRFYNAKVIKDLPICNITNKTEGEK